MNGILRFLLQRVEEVLEQYDVGLERTPLKQLGRCHSEKKGRGTLGFSVSCSHSLIFATEPKYLLIENGLWGIDGIALQTCPARSSSID